MRILMIQPGPNFSVSDVHDGWAEALRRHGQQVIEYNLDDRITFYDSALMAEDLFDNYKRQAVHKALSREQAIEMAANGILSAAMQTWPDVVFITSVFFVPGWILEVLRARRMNIVMLFTESPYQDGQQLEVAKYADVIMLNDPVTLDQYQALGVPVAYMPHAYRPAVHHPPPAGVEKPYDLSFIGTGFPSRVEFFEAMNLDGLNVQLGGFWLDLPRKSPLHKWVSADHADCLDNTDTADIYRASKCGINFYRREGEDGAAQGVACGPREIEMAACGLFFVRDPRPESDELFPMLPAYSSPQEAGELIRWYAAHPVERDLAAAASRAAIADRTFVNHARKLLAMLEH